MPSIHINQIDHHDHLFIQRTQRIYIDPQELIALKNQRKSFKMVKSIYQPIQDDYSLVENNFYDKSSKQQIKNQLYKKNLSSPKLLSNRYSHQNNIHNHQTTKSLQQIIENQKISPNVQFIWKLIPSNMKKQINSYQEGDCIPFSQSKTKQQCKFLILSGQVKIIGKNQNSFRRKAGYLYFLSNETKDKVKEIVVLKSTKILQIPFTIYQGIIRPYLRLKYSERLNFINICPFFIWNDQLSEDLATCMQMILTQKQEIIYHSNQFADKIYFVKQGIVLLQRNTVIKNSLIEGYEDHYEKNQITEKDVILVVRKGMVFGVDGVIIKQFAQKSKQFQQKNLLMQKPSYSPQFHHTIQTKERSNQRIYTARTLGKCEIYCLDKKILETLFTIDDISDNFLIHKKKISTEQLERLSHQYTSMLFSQGLVGINKIPLKKKQIQLNVQNNLETKSKSLASIQQRSMPFMKNNKKIQENNSQPKFSHKRTFSQSQQKSEQVKEQKEYEKFYLKEENQINQLRNRIKSQREKQKLLSIKKPIKQSDINKNQIDPNQKYNLPKIFLKKQKSFSKQKPFELQKQIKLDSIIKKKLKEDLQIYTNNSPKLQKAQSTEIPNDKTNQKSQLVRFLEEQNIKNKSNPSFINIKSYKSIDSVLSSALKI